MSFLTIFTAPKSFKNPHIAIIQRNALRSWIKLGSDVDVLLIGNEDGLADVAADLRIRHIAEVTRNTYGTPLIGSLFDVARRESDSPILLFANTDILFQSDLIQASRLVAKQLSHFLIVGQRYDLMIEQMLEFSPDWEIRLRKLCSEKGRLHPRGGSDYFIYPRDCFTRIPSLAVGRAGWDNWMIYEARRCGWATIDATKDIQVIHQDHDYSHLPNGQPHYKLPESNDNIRAAGGKRVIFTLMDTNFRLVEGKIIHVILTWEKLKRELEIFPLVYLHSHWLAQIFFALFHPIMMYREFRQYSRTK